MNNANGNNGHVTIKLREKAERILCVRHENISNELKHRHEKLEKKHKKDVLRDLGIEKLVQRYKKLKEECEEIEEQIKIKAGRCYFSYSDIERDDVGGSKIKKEVDKRVKAERDFEAEQKALETLKLQLMEDLWLVDQTDEVKAILAKMK
jgi:hypothetical protein